MRTIKFRAWDKENKRWMTPEIEDSEESELRLDIWGNLHFRIPWFEQESGIITIVAGESMFDLSQYTGLKDKDGAEIYEGDILEVEKNDDGTYKGTINGKTFFDRFQGYSTRVKVDGMHDIYTLRYWNNRVRIIGNIWEDPELLEEI